MSSIETGPYLNGFAFTKSWIYPSSIRGEFHEYFRLHRYSRQPNNRYISTGRGVMTCSHEPVVMVDRGPDGGFHAECKYCGMSALTCETQEKAMLDWVKMNRPYAAVIELLLPAAPFMAAIVIFTAWNLR